MKKIDKYDFHNGVEIPKKILKKWRNEMLESLDINKGTFWLHTSGRGLVIGLKMNDNTVTVYEISKGFKEYTYEKK